MAHFRDWLELGKSTLSSLSRDDVANLYVIEWPETRKILVADHQTAIEQQGGRVRRWLRTCSAILFGLAKRLAPHRRILFVLSWVAFFVCMTSLFARMSSPPFWTFVEVAVTFVVMTLLLGMELIDKIKFRDELALARDLQASLIPRHPVQTPHYEIAAFNHIANTVGGDIYDFVPLANGRLAVLFGDASGHGMAAGLVMAVAHAAFRTQLDVDPSPTAITTALNRILCRTGGSRSFFSCCYVLLEPDGRFVATVAGHPTILRIDKAGIVVEHIGRGAYPLGVKSELEWEEQQSSLQPGERLLFHSDGLTESRNAQDREFGDAYLETMVGWHPSDSATGVIETIVGEWKMFSGGKPPEDDVSIAVIVRR